MGGLLLGGFLSGLSQGIAGGVERRRQQEQADRDKWFTFWANQVYNNHDLDSGQIQHALGEMQKYAPPETKKTLQQSSPVIHALSGIRRLVAGKNDEAQTRARRGAPAVLPTDATPAATPPADSGAPVAPDRLPPIPTIGSDAKQQFAVGPTAAAPPAATTPPPAPPKNAKQRFSDFAIPGYEERTEHEIDLETKKEDARLQAGERSQKRILDEKIKTIDARTDLSPEEKKQLISEAIIGSKANPVAAQGRRVDEVYVNQEDPADKMYVSTDTKSGQHYDTHDPTKVVSIPDNYVPLNAEGKPEFEKVPFLMPNEKMPRIFLRNKRDPTGTLINPYPGPGESKVVKDLHGGHELSSAEMQALARDEYSGMYNDVRRTEKARAEAQGYTPEQADQFAQQQAGIIVDNLYRNRLEYQYAPHETYPAGIVGGQMVGGQNIPQPRPLPAGVAPTQLPPPPPPAQPPPTGTAPAPAVQPQVTPPAPSTTPRLQVSPTPKPAPAPRAAAPAAQPPAGAPAGGRTIPVRDSDYRQYLNNVRSASVATDEIYGSLDSPTLGGIAQYAGLADNPGARQRLGKAITLSLEGFAQSHGGGTAGVSVGEMSFDVAGVGNWLGNVLGIPAATADQQARQLQSAIGDLKPRERQYFNSLMASFEAATPLRGFLQGSSAQGSIQQIQRLIPAIGRNANDSASFVQDLRQLSLIPAEGVSGIPLGNMAPPERKKIQNIQALPNRLNALQRRPSQHGQKLTDTSIRDQYLDAAGGDKQRARQMALADGWTL